MTFELEVLSTLSVMDYSYSGWAPPDYKFLKDLPVEFVPPTDLMKRLSHKIYDTFNGNASPLKGGKVLRCGYVGRFIIVEMTVWSIESLKSTLKYREFSVDDVYENIPYEVMSIIVESDNVSCVLDGYHEQYSLKLSTQFIF